MFDWYKIFNMSEFESLGLVSKTYTLFFENIGQESYTVTKGNEISVLFRDVFLPVNFQERNPYVRDGYAVFFDSATDDIYLGVAID